MLDVILDISALNFMHQETNMSSSSSTRLNVLRRRLLQAGGLSIATNMLTACGPGKMLTSQSIHETGNHVQGSAAVTAENINDLINQKTASAMKLKYNLPGIAWGQETIPMGNGHLLAHIFGNPVNESIPLNETSLYDGSSGSHGIYKFLGEINMSSDQYIVSNPNAGTSEHDNAKELVDNTITNDMNTKWCIGGPVTPVVWILSFDYPKLVEGYTIITAQDAPWRDPSGWRVFGSANNQDWTEIDHQDNNPLNGANRLQRFHYKITNPATYMYYKIEFALSLSPTNEGPYFQVSKIYLDGLTRETAYLSSPSGHSGMSNSGLGIDQTITDNGKYWQIGDISSPVQWMLHFVNPQVINSYSITVPDQTSTPAGIKLESSSDGINWAQLDQHDTNELGINNKIEKTFDNANGYAYYRFTFEPPANQNIKIINIRLLGPKIDTISKDALNAIVEYSRELDMTSGIHTSIWWKNGIQYSKEIFISLPDRVLVCMVNANQPGTINGQIQLTPSGTLATGKGAMISSTITNNLESFSGSLPNKLQYACSLKIIPSGEGSSASTKPDGHGLLYERCDSLMMILACRTNFKMDYFAGWRTSDNPIDQVELDIKNATNIGYIGLKENHIKDYGNLMNRVHVSWGDSNKVLTAKTTDQRRLNYIQSPETNPDPELEQLAFQMGRYLMICSSREGGAPAWLIPWTQSDDSVNESTMYADINCFETYWPAEVVNLSECHLPFLNWIDQAHYPLTSQTKQDKGVPGWTGKTIFDLYGNGTYLYLDQVSGWFCQHLFEHYLFTMDMDYLERVAYPSIKGATLFWQAYLVLRQSDQKWISPPGWSPEHGPGYRNNGFDAPVNPSLWPPGIKMTMQIIWELFGNFITSAQILQVDSDLVTAISKIRKNLVGNTIGSKGQLQEWDADIDPNYTPHRHTSHLYAVYPGYQITPRNNQEFASAALLSLRRSNSNQWDNKPTTKLSQIVGELEEWSPGWRCALFSRLNSANEAYTMLNCYMSRYTSKVMGNYAPSWKDGEYGVTAGIAEMLLQSHEQRIVLLPALPDIWKSGYFVGFRARGGYTVDCIWSKNMISQFKIYSNSNVTPINVLVNGVEMLVTPSNAWIDLMDRNS